MGNYQDIPGNIYNINQQPISYDGMDARKDGRSFRNMDSYYSYNVEKGDVKTPTELVSGTAKEIDKYSKRISQNAAYYGTEIGKATSGVSKYLATEGVKFYNE